MENKSLDEGNSDENDNDLVIPLDEAKHTKEEQSVKEERNINYYEANVLSFLFFWWSKITMTLANNRNLKLGDISQLSKEQTTEVAYPKIYEYFLHFSKNKKHAYPLLYSLFKYHCWSFILLTVINHLELVLNYVHIYFFRQVILHFSMSATDNAASITPNPSPSLSSLLSLKGNAICLIITKVIFTLLTNQVNFFEMLLAERITNQVNALIYNKILVSSANCNDISSKTSAEKINLVDVDSQKVGFLFFVGPKLITAPMQIFSSFWVLFNLFGYNFLYGFSALCLVLTGILILQYLFIRNQRKHLRKQDEVMKIEKHVFHILKMLKMYGWDDECIKQIKAKKNEEFHLVQNNMTIIIFRSLLNNNLPLLMLSVTLGSYAFKAQPFDISDLFTAIQMINSMTRPLIGIPMFLNGFFSNLLSINRIQELLYGKEHDFKSYEDSSRPSISVKLTNCSFGINNKNEEETQTKTKTKDEEEELKTIDTKIQVEEKQSNKTHSPSSYHHSQSTPSTSDSITLLNDISLEINKGELVGIIGQTGSGKSCLLNAIMNNLDIFNKDELVINGTISFASQLPWIMNETIQNNILFFNEMNQEKYDKILQDCQLTHDLSDFTNGDKTEISSAGTTLSGGQKARLSLARAIYRNADIYLLDDPFASVDSKVSNLIFQNIVLGYLKEKTRILVTNNIGHLEYVDKIIMIDKGSIKWLGTYKEFKQLYEEEFCQEATKAKKEAESMKVKGSNEPDASIGYNKDNDKSMKIKRIPMIKEGRLIIEEDSSKDQIPLSIYHKYIHLKGGYCLFLFIIILMLIVQISKLCREIHMTSWAQNSKNHKLTYQENLYNFNSYVEISAIGIITRFIIDFIVSGSTIRILRILHQSMILRLVKAPINLFHDIIPIGRILNRLTKDLERVKKSQHIMNRFIESSISLLISIYVCYKYNPYSLLVSPFLLIAGIFITKYYIFAGRNLDRFRRMTFSPILNLVSESILGIETIRVTGNESHIQRKFYDKLDSHYSVNVFSEGAERWYSIFLDLASHLFYALIIVFIIIYKDNFTAQAIGLILQYSASFSGQLMLSFESLTSIEKGMVSLERCDAYIFIPSEKNIPLKNSAVNERKSWPSRGTIKFTDYTTRYRPDTHVVLNDINLLIKSKEHIGIVGRTGSGKSTLSLALCRILEAEKGKIEIDGIDISKVNLEFLRQQICLVPQDAFVLEGTLRDNVDPMNQCTNEEILEVLKEITLFQELSDEDKLAFVIKENGNNLSFGQRQLIGFARAVLKKSKVIVLDEATSNLDIQTETIIKNNIKKYFSQATLIIIAHRIQMVNECHRIMVVDNGKIAENGTYTDLLKDHSSLFYSLYSESLKQ